MVFCLELDCGVSIFVREPLVWVMVGVSILTEFRSMLVLVIVHTWPCLVIRPPVFSQLLCGEFENVKNRPKLRFFA